MSEPISTEFFTLSNVKVTDPTLLKYFTKLYSHRHAKSTQKSYTTGKNYALKFLQSQKIILNPLVWDDSTCALFVTWILQTRKIKAVSARGYLFGAKAFLRSAGIAVPKETPITNDVLKGHNVCFLRLKEFGNQ